MLAEHFDGVRETLILLPKKNGKSTILAARGLMHICATPDAECIIVAASREQAEIILRAARGFVRRSPALQQRLRVKQREIMHPGHDGKLVVRASDVDTVDGWIGTLGLVDELHRHKTPDLYGVIRDGLGPRGGQMITISTAGDDETSPLGQLRSMAYALPGMKRKGAHRWVRTDGFAMHEWALDPDDDREDVKVVKRANPAPWQTTEELRERLLSPSMTPWQWARFACGVWVFGEQGAISEKEWRACEDAKARIPDGTAGPVIAIDLGWRWDTTAIVPMLAQGEKIVLDEPVIVEPPRDGTATDAEEIKDVLRKMDGRWSEIIAVIDPEADGEQLAQWIEAELGWTVVTHSQKASPMALAAQRLSELISATRLQHPGDPEFTRHVLAAAPKPVGEGWRLVKPKRSGAMIDGAIALAMGVSVIVGGQANPEPMFAWR
jgi:phage terminase large subunit-like protein